MNGLFLGLNTVDIQFLVDEYPGPNTKTLVNRNGVYLGGPATNAAITFSKLGGKSTLLTSIGNHFLRQFIINELGVLNIKYLDINDNINIHPVISSVITSGRKGERTVFTFNPADNTKRLDNASDILLMSGNILNTCEIILMDGFFIDLATEIAITAKEHSIRIVLDGGSWKKGTEKLLEFVDIVICSQNFYPPGTTNEKEVLEYLSSYSCEEIAVTRGHRTILYKDKSAFQEIPVAKINAIDTLGAGDILHGAFCYYYLKTHNFVKALTNASKIASESCKYLGTREW